MALPSVSSTFSNRTWTNSLRVKSASVLSQSSVVVKCLCVAVSIGYFISFSERAVEALTVVPGNVVPPNFWFWTYITHCFLELHCWMVAADVVVILLYGWLLEPLWGALEMLRFYVVVNIPVAVLTTLSYLFMYLISRNTDYLFSVHIYGLAGYLAGFTVALKQTMPDQVLLNTPLGRLRTGHIPLCVMGLAVILGLVKALDFVFPIMFGWGLLVSWIYLRFYQRQSNGVCGDAAESFSFASFFPEQILPVVAVISNTVYSALIEMKLCKKPSKNVSPSTTISVTLPGTDTQDAERRRQLALKALNERLSKVSSPGWMSVEEAELKRTPPTTPELSDKDLPGTPVRRESGKPIPTFSLESETSSAASTPGGPN